MSQMDSQTATIGGHKFEVFKLPPLDAQDTLIDLMQALAPAASMLAGGVGQFLDSDLSSPKIADAIGQLARGLSKERMRALVLQMAHVTHCDGAELHTTYEMVFRGDLPLMYQWLWFALKTQYGNFSGLVQSALRQAAQGDEQADQSLST